MFRTLVLILVTGDIIDIASAAAVPTFTASNNSELTIAQKEEVVATITLGDIEQYANYEGTDTVEKRSVAIFPTGIITAIPTDGIHAVFGPDLQADMDKVIQAKCGDSDHMDECQKDISKLLQDNSLGNHTKRFIPVVVAAATVAEVLGNVIAGIVGALGGLALGAGINAATAPGSVNLEHVEDTENGVLDQISSLSDARVVAIATGIDNKPMVTVTLTNTVGAPSPTNTPTEEVRIEQLKVDDGIYKKGDIILHIPKDTGNKLMDYLGMWGLDQLKETCKSSKPGPINNRKRAPPLDPECEEMVRQMSVQILQETNSNALRNLVRVNEANPMNPAQNRDGAVVPNIRNDEVLTVIIIVRGELDDPDIEQISLGEMLMRGAIVTETVLAAALDAIEEKGNEFTILFEQSAMEKVKEEDAKCENDLFCVSDHCKGLMEIGIPLIASEIIQTGFCTMKEVKGCPCTKLLEPYVHEIEEGYLEALEAWQQEILKPIKGANCDSNNKIDLDASDYDDEVHSACQQHDELKRLKKRDNNAFWWTNVDGNGVQWSFDWNDKGNCDFQCEDIFDYFQDDRDCSWDGGMTKAGFIETDCGIASYSIDKPNPECWPAAVGVPRGLKETEDQPGTSVDEALEDFCNNIDGQKVEDSSDDSVKMHAKRWGFAEWGVPDRRSFWLRAQYANRSGCGGYEWPRKTNCKAAFKEAMETCAPDSPRTTGFIVSGIGCIDYSLHVTDNTHDDSPPWKDPVIAFPPPISAPSKGAENSVVCATIGGYGRPLTKDDMEKAFDAICQDGKDIRGFGDNPKWSNMIDYPPQGQPQFYPNDRLTMHLTMGAATPDNGEPYPYDDNWCLNYDWKIGREDCQYALRRIYGTCGKEDGVQGGDYTYRCVHYKTWHVNLGN
ncbi:hypothetical protein BDV96DRAFT_600430 [Lophiotrema nucula]|uniref:Uncharacterized protein n=1 Tax=Lophiotrema nucula TaxID=690887 RepID=A0A6A5Z615_9PLEO|nr:hypothetical protein BDV96DRAFT_600430 [Lophiotrema nucula]